MVARTFQERCNLLSTTCTIYIIINGICLFRFENGLMERKVVRVITPGTLLDPLLPDANYLLSIHKGLNDTLGLAWLDISTGQFFISSCDLSDLPGELERIDPVEVPVL